QDAQGVRKAGNVDPFLLQRGETVDLVLPVADAERRAGAEAVTHHRSPWRRCGGRACRWAPRRAVVPPDRWIPSAAGAVSASRAAGSTYALRSLPESRARRSLARTPASPHIAATSGPLRVAPSRFSASGY